jgi:hypothetical protein
MIDLHDHDARRRVLRASRLLKKEATILYTAANELEREERQDPSPAKYQAGRIARRVIKDGHLDGDVVAEYIDRWASNRAAVAGTWKELRAHGHDIWHLAEVLAATSANYLEWARKERRGKPGGKPGGALPSVAMDYLIAHTTKWEATRREIAERLVEHDVMPPPPRSEDPDPDSVARWMTILRSGRSRARNR